MCDAACGAQVEIARVLGMRQPLVLRGSSERASLHIAHRLKPSEGSAAGAELIERLLSGRACSATPLMSAAARGSPPREIPAAVVYCVSKAQVAEMVTLLSRQPLFAGKVRRSRGRGV